MMMQKIYSILLFAALPAGAMAQTVLNNDGGSINISSAGQVYVSGGMSNSSSATLTNDGQLTVTGTFSNDAPMTTPAAGTLYFDGAVPQSIAGTADYFAKDVVVNNPSGIVLLNAKLKIDGVISFNRGIITTPFPAYSVVFTENGAVSGAFPPSDLSHINGYVTKEGIGAFTFPVGNGTRYQPIGVDLNANSSGLSAHYVAGDAGNAPFGTAGTSSTPLLYYNAKEYWELTPAGSATGSVTLYWDAFNNTGIANTGDLRVAHLSGAAWLNEGANNVNGNVSAGSITSNSLSTWSPFTLGSISNASPLPVQILSFDVKMMSNANRVSWYSGSEEQGSIFEIERSMDGRTFNKIGVQKPLGNGTAYSFDDLAPEAGTTYYRLHVTGNKGYYTKVVSLTRTSGSGVMVSVYPNPALDYLVIDASAKGTVTVRDMTGKIVLQAPVQDRTTLDVSMLTPGIYFTTIQTEGHNESIRLIKK